MENQKFINSEPIDFNQNVLVFIHIRKSAGSTVSESLRSFVGNDNFLTLKNARLERYYRSRIDCLLKGAEFRFRSFYWRQMGSHPLAYRTPGETLERINVFHGHIGIGLEPRVSRSPVYFSVLREPVDQFLSIFYHEKERAKLLGSRYRERIFFDGNGQFFESPGAFLSALEKSGLKNWRDTQCRYFGGEPDTGVALETIQASNCRIFQFPRMAELESWLRLGLGDEFRLGQSERVGRLRRSLQAELEADPNLEDRVREAFQNDVALFEEFRGVHPSA